MDGARVCYMDGAYELSGYAMSPMKRVFDIAVSVAAIAVLAPAYVLLAFLVLIFDGRPVLFFQKRRGFCGEPFSICKFRTMKDGVPTGFGNILRGTHLDELPQFFSVLWGDMSLVGPRPEEIQMHDRKSMEIPEYQERLLAYPGLTGPAQVMEMHDADTMEKFLCDMRYLRDASFLYDLKIILLTVAGYGRKET